MNYSLQQATMSLDLAQLILYASEQGYAARIDSLDGLQAVVILLDEMGSELTMPEDYGFLADYWESLSTRNRHGRSYKDPNPQLFERVKE